MKKMLVIILSFILLISGCDAPAYYNGSNFDLYIQAVNSILSVQGYGYKGSAPIIKVVEEDDYGRRLFTYQGDIQSSDNQGTAAILISQKSDDKYVYYYPNYSYILVKTSNWIDVDKDVSPEEIETIKELNDWNKEISLDKCTKKEIKKRKETIKITKQMEKNFEIMFHNLADKYGYLGEDTIYRYATYCTTDVNGKTLYYLYGIGRDVYGQGVNPSSTHQKFYMAAILKNDFSYDINRCYIELIDLRNYQEDLIKLKEANNWQDY